MLVSHLLDLLGSFLLEYFDPALLIVTCSLHYYDRSFTASNFEQSATITPYRLISLSLTICSIVYTDTISFIKAGNFKSLVSAICICNFQP